MVYVDTSVLVALIVPEPRSAAVARGTAAAGLSSCPLPNPAKYPRQKVMVVEVTGYAYLVPFVEEDNHFFLKTIIPSRKATRDYIAKESDDVQT